MHASLARKPLCEFLLTAILAKFKHLRDPVFVLELALYGHPDSAGHWEKFCEDALIKTLGWTKVVKISWRSVFWHEASKAFLIVYVDDFRLSGPAYAVPKLFEEIGNHIKIRKPDISMDATVKCSKQNI